MIGKRKFKPQASDVFRLLLKNSTWKRHPQPFAKSSKGLARRCQRRFIDNNKRFAGV